MTNVIINPGKEYAPESRMWQGVPSIEMTGKRLWAGWFTGGKYEPSIENYCVAAYSDDDGCTWKDPYMAVVAKEGAGYRTYDNQMWKDNLGRLWMFWGEDIYKETAEASDFDTPFDSLGLSYFGHLEQWSVVCENPEDEIPVWSEPRLMWTGFSRNNPLVLSDGRWIVSVYDMTEGESGLVFDTKFAISDDNGKSFREVKGPVESSNAFCEPMTVELKDGTLWCLIRTMSGYLDESFSYDRGETWSEVRQTKIPNPSTRFYIGRADNDMLLLVNTPSATLGDRKSLVASLSEDEGKTWKYNLKIDDRRSTTYPDVAFGEDGFMYIIYDVQRDNRQEPDKDDPFISHAEKEVCFAKIKMEDILAGELVTEGSRLQNIISKIYYNSRKPR